MATKEKVGEGGMLTQCTICGGNAWDFVLEGRDLLRPAEETKYRLSRCKSCGHVMQTPQPSAEELHKAYSVGYKPYLCAWKEPGWPLWKILRQFTTWRRMLCLRHYGKGHRLLEVGAGSGDFLYAAHRAGWEVKAIEYNDKLATSLRDELGLDVQSGELKSGLWREGEFDVIALWNVLEHLRHPLETLVTLSSYLRTGGSLLFQIPTLDAIRGGTWFGECWAALDLPRHLNFFSRASLRQLCNKVGMELAIYETPFLGTAWYYYASIVNYASQPGQTPKRLLQLAPLTLLSIAASPYVAVRAWLRHGNEAFALATKR